MSPLPTMHHLHKANTHQPLAALAQKQQSAGAQFNGEAAFASLLDARDPGDVSGDYNQTSKKWNDNREPTPQARQDRAAPEKARKTLPPESVENHPGHKLETTYPPVAVDAKANGSDEKSGDVRCDVIIQKKNQIREHGPVKLPEESVVEPVSQDPALEPLPIILVVQDPPIKAAPPHIAGIAVSLPAPMTVADPAPAVTPESPVVPAPTPAAVLPILVPAGPRTPVGNEKEPVPIALNDVLITKKPRLPVQAAPGLGDELPDLPALSTPGETLSETTAAGGKSVVDARPVASTHADLTRAAASLLQQLTPAIYAAAQPGLTVASKLQEAVTVDATAAVQILQQQAVTADAPALATPNPLLVQAETQGQVVTINPGVQTANPVLNAATSAQAAALATAAKTNEGALLANGQANNESVNFDAGFSSHALARYDTGSLAKAGRLSNTAAGAVLPANIQVAVQLARAAKSGDRAFNIQLHPAELGRVEVKLDVDGKGAATARIMVDSQATLDLLLQHRQGLERALTDAGLQCDTGGISFELRDGGSQPGQQQATGQNGSRGGKNNAANLLSGIADATPDTSITANLTLSLQPGRVDIKA